MPFLTSSRVTIARLDPRIASIYPIATCICFLADARLCNVTTCLICFSSVFAPNPATGSHGGARGQWPSCRRTKCRFASSPMGSGRALEANEKSSAREFPCCEQGAIDLLSPRRAMTIVARGQTMFGNCSLSPRQSAPSPSCRHSGRRSWFGFMLTNRPVHEVLQTLPVRPESNGTKNQCGICSFLPRASSPLAQTVSSTLLF